jgi:hypothetical protein
LIIFTGKEVEDHEKQVSVDANIISSPGPSRL